MEGARGGIIIPKLNHFPFYNAHLKFGLPTWKFGLAMGLLLVLKTPIKKVYLTINYLQYIMLMPYSKYFQKE